MNQTAMKIKKHLRKSWQLYLLILPGLLYLIIFHYVPMFGLQLAFKEYFPALGMKSPWVGLYNFNRFFSSFVSRSIIWNTFFLGLLSLFITFPIPVIFALFLNQMRSQKYKKFVQTITYAPYFISTIVMVGMLYLFLSPSTGVISLVITLLGGQAKLFMGNPEWFRPVYVLSDIWQKTGFGMILYLATLSNVDINLYEACQIDGASKFKQMLYIDVPLLFEVVVIVFILNAGQIMSSNFEKVYLMQNTVNLSVSEIISTYVYKIGLLQADFSYATAVGLFNSLVNFTLLIIVNRIIRVLKGTSLF